MKIKCIKQRVKNFLIRSYTRVYSWFHPIEKKILFISFGGDSYSDSPRAISEKMHEMYPEYKLVWCLQNKQEQTLILPEYVEIVGGKTELYKALATSFCFVNNFQMESNFYKRKNQFFIQTWHGDRGLKKVLHDAWENGKRPLPVCDNKVTDVCIAASNYGVQVYKSGFQYEKSILKIGTPRNDKLIHSSKAEIEMLKKQMKIPENTNVLLYAPTFRDHKVGQQILIDIESVLDILCRNGKEWICLLRAHPGRKGFDFSSARTFDMSNYSDMTDLLMVADMLITDYSSCAGDFILKKKPVVLAVFDREDYENNSRELNVKLEETGYILAHNQEELESIILNTKKEEYIDSANAVLEFYGDVIENGCASEIVCDKINDFWKAKFSKEAIRRNT